MQSSLFKKSNIITMQTEIYKPRKLNLFPKVLAANQKEMFYYIIDMVSGNPQNQENYSHYIFAYLRNVIENQMKSQILRNACKFIMTTLLLGNLHLYEHFIEYLMPSFTEKITMKKEVRPVWQIQQFALQTIFVLSEWLPQNFYISTQPSIFKQIVKKYSISFERFAFYNMEKIVFCYRIIKELGLNVDEQNCQRCQGSSQSKICKFPKQNSNLSNLESRRAVFKKYANKKGGEIWETGFQKETQNNYVGNENDSVFSFESIHIKDSTKSPAKIKTFTLSDYQLRSKKSTEQKEHQINRKIKRIHDQIAQVKTTLYEKQQAKLIGKLSQRLSKKEKVDSKTSQSRQRHEINQQMPIEADFNPLEKIESINLSDQQKKKQQQKLEKAISNPLLTKTTVPKSLKSAKSFEKLSKHKNPQLQTSFEQRLILELTANHLKIFEKFFQNSKSDRLINKFKQSLLSPKAFLYLKKNESIALKCRTNYKEPNLLKLKFFIEENSQNKGQPTQKKTIFGGTSALQLKNDWLMSQIKSKISLISDVKDMDEKLEIQLIEPQEHTVKSHDSEKMEIIFQISDNANFKPICIRINQDPPFPLPIGYFHVIDSFSIKKISKSQMKVFQAQENNESFQVYRNFFEFNKALWQNMEGLQKHFNKVFRSQSENEVNFQSDDEVLMIRGKCLQTQFMITIQTEVANRRISDSNPQIPNNKKDSFEIAGYVISSEKLMSLRIDNTLTAEKHLIKSLTAEMQFCLSI